MAIENLILGTVATGYAVILTRSAWLSGRSVYDVPCDISGRVGKIRGT